MRNLLSRELQTHQWFRFLFLLILFILSGCCRESDPRTVDFDKTMPVARPGEKSSDRQSLRVAVGAMVSPKETFVYYRQLLDYLANNLDREAQLVQRKTYREINELIGKGQIDLAFICSGPYVSGKDRYGIELLATPEVQGSHFYHSYLIVNKENQFQSMEDLRGRVFAFTDPDSLTGRLVPTFWLAEMHKRPETFFAKVIYTYSHDNSILAVARGLVDGAAVDGLIWEYYQQKNPSWTSGTRVIKKSEPYGIPPVVVSKALPLELKERMQQLLLSMHQDAGGQKILHELMIDRFLAPQAEWYDTVGQVERKLSIGME
jgi:phosphonate transport system substrate-binding protein